MVEQAPAEVVYTLLRRHEFAGDTYWLLRLEGGETEILVYGRGLSMRLHIVTYLREVGELAGPDAPAALLALRRGWSLADASGLP